MSIAVAYLTGGGTALVTNGSAGVAPASGVFAFDSTGAAQYQYYAGNAVSGTAVGLPVKAANLPVASSSYTFITTQDQFMKIVSAQCDRVGHFINNSLAHLDRTDDDRNEEIIDHIAEVIDLVGEPAVCTAALKAQFLEENSFVFERLIMAIGTAQHRESEADRLDILRAYATHHDRKIRHAAVRALGRMNTPQAKKILRDISSGSKMYGGGEITRYAAALLR